MLCNTERIPCDKVTLLAFYGVQGMGNPMKMEFFHADHIIKNSQASPLCDVEVPAENLV
jgi:hypothetical protein